MPLCFIVKIEGKWIEKKKYFLIQAIYYRNNYLLSFFLVKIMQNGNLMFDDHSKTAAQ